ncbi:MAG TPA: hypothetical protein VF035_04425 [Longimicrobiales bacterium]
MTLALLFRGLLRRELAPSALGGMLVTAAAAGAALALLSVRVDSGQGITQLIREGDRTLAGVFAITAVFRIIGRLSDDADRAWPLQLVAAGAARPAYVTALTIATALTALISYTAGAWTFAGVAAAAGGGQAALVRAVAALPLVALMLFCAATFGAAAFCAVGGAAARPLAVVVIILPWILVAIFAVGGDDALPFIVVRIASLPAPPLAVSASVHDVGTMMIYAGVSFACAVTTAERRIARL